ncbi:MAG: CRISPR-associated endonuclease Cas2 [Desulfotomaculum sp.]|nr:CRISPR-associated endonuclease Cas2 [Desulfotomaculum sp.]
MKNYIIAYDITDDRRRNKIHKALKDYAVPVQYSVFEARLSDKDYITLQHKLERLMNSKEDSIIFYRQCARCSEDLLRMGKSADPFGDGIFIL